MTEDMTVRPFYYLWSKGLFPLNKTIYNDFMRDAEYRESLKGKSIDVLIPIFTELKNASNYSPDSYIYRAINNYKIDNVSINIQDIYCIDSNETQGDMCVITIENKIANFQFIKG